MGLGEILDGIRDAGRQVFAMELHDGLIPSSAQIDDIDAIEDVIMVGYPNGIWDETNATPVVRRGITATPYRLDYQGRREFLIDAACFGGSSGSPVFLHNPSIFTTRKGEIIPGRRFFLLGVLSKLYQQTLKGTIKVVEVPTAKEPVPVTMVPNALGLVIKASRILEFEPLIRAHIIGDEPGSPSQQAIAPTR